MISTSERVRAASLLQWRGDHLCDIAVGGLAVDVVVSVDEEERARRDSFELTYVCDRELMQVLATLPSGIAISESCLDPLHRVILDNAPPGLVEWRNGDVVNHYRPVFHVLGILLSTHRNADARRLGALASIAPRALLIPARNERALAETAIELELGLILQLATGDLLLRASPNDHYVRSGWRRWQFSEVVLKDWLRQRSKR